MKLKKFYIPLIFFLVSFIFWGAINLSEEFTIEILVPLKIINNSPEYSIDSEIPDEILLKIKSNGWDLIRIKLDREKKLTLNLNDYSNLPLINLKELQPTDFGLFSSTKILEVKPQYLKLTQKISVEKLLPVIPRLKINFRNGYNIVSKILISPDKVVAKGTASMLAKIDSIYTEEIVLNDVYDDVKLTVQIKDTLTNTIVLNQKSVNVSFKVEQIVDKEFTNIPIQIETQDFSDNIELIPSTINLTVRGGIKSLANLDISEIKVKAKIDISTLDSLDTIKPEITLPYGMSLIKTEPEYSKIVLHKEK